MLLKGETNQTHREPTQGQGETVSETTRSCRECKFATCPLRERTETIAESCSFYWWRGKLSKLAKEYVLAELKKIKVEMDKEKP